MHVIIWEYQVRAERAAEFEKIYATDGAWAELFKKGKGFVKTELLRDQQHPHRYLTIDRWTSLDEYESFRSQWKDEYERLDTQCESLIEEETLLGIWEAIEHETR